MKAVSALNYILMALMISVSVVFITYYMIMLFFGPLFEAKSSGPDDMYRGIGTLINVMPLVLFISTIILVLILIFLKSYLAPITLSLILVALGIFFIQPNFNLSKKISNYRQQASLKKLLSEIDFKFYQLLTNVSNSNTPFESVELSKAVEDLILMANLSEPQILKSPNFKSLHGFATKQGIKSIDSKFLYVTPLLNKVLLQNIKSENKDSYGIEVREWNESRGAVPYLKLANIASLESGGVLGIAIYFTYENTKYPIKDIIITIPMVKKNFQPSEVYTSFGELFNEYDPEIQQIYFNKKYEQLGMQGLNDFLNLFTIFYKKDLEDNKHLASSLQRN